MKLDDTTKSNDNVLQNSLKEKFLKKVITDIKEITQALAQVSVKLNNGTQELIKKINANLNELNQFVDDKEFNDETALKVVLSQLQSRLQKLPPQLKQLPYSNKTSINNLCNAINTILEKLANFLMNGPIVSEGVYISVPYKSYNFNLFHPFRSINISVESSSEKSMDALSLA